jgi:hypothetical protein
MVDMQTATFQNSKTERAMRRANGPKLTLVTDRSEAVCTRSRKVSRDHPAFGFLASDTVDRTGRSDDGVATTEPEALDPNRSLGGSGLQGSSGSASSGSGPKTKGPTTRRTHDAHHSDAESEAHMMSDDDSRTSDAHDDASEVEGSPDSEWEFHRWRFAQKVAEFEANAEHHGVTWSD